MKPESRGGGCGRTGQLYLNCSTTDESDKEDRVACDGVLATGSFVGFQVSTVGHGRLIKHDFALLYKDWSERQFHTWFQRHLTTLEEISLWYAGLKCRESRAERALEPKRTRWGMKIYN